MKAAAKKKGESRKAARLREFKRAIRALVRSARDYDAAAGEGPGAAFRLAKREGEA